MCIRDRPGSTLSFTLSRKTNSTGCAAEATTSCLGAAGAAGAAGAVPLTAGVRVAVVSTLSQPRMSKTSLDKSKIKILLLEGIHPSAVEAFRADGYSTIESHPKALPEAKLLDAIGDTYVVGIRSATQPVSYTHLRCQ